MANKTWSNLFRGTYDNATAYTKGDIVNYNGSSYTCIANSTGNLPTDTSYWTLIASKGDTGATGATGADSTVPGPAGADGRSFVWLGDWVTSTAYAVDDVVAQGGSSYICLEAHTSGTFATDLAASKWELMAQKGTDGTGTMNGPASSTDNAIAVYDGMTGSLLKDSIIKLVTTVFSPTSSDGAALGSGLLMWSDLFLASGGVINFNNGNATITHSAGLLSFSTAIRTSGTYGFTSSTKLNGTAADGNLALTNNAGTDFGLLQLGGTTSSFPALKRNSTGIDFKLADDSAYATITANTIELGAATDTTISRSSAGKIAVEGNEVLTVAGGTLTGNITLGENTSIDLDPAGSADGKYSGICIAGTAGTTLAFGDLVYLAAADSRWELADADAATTADRLLGMCVLAAAADGNATKILLQGNIRADAAFPALTIGSPVYVGETAGDIQTAIPTGADNVIRRVGYALTADELYFAPSMDSQVTVA